MKKKYILGLFILIVAFTLTGCGKNDTATLVSGPSCKKELENQTLEYIANIENERLKSFDIVTTYKYTSLDAMKSACNNNKKEEKEMNSKNIYVKYKVTCDENKQTMRIEKLYDTEKSMKESNIKNMLSYVYKYIKENGQFDLEGWKESNMKDGFSCN